MIIDSHCHAWTSWPIEARVPDPESRGRVEHLVFEMDRNEVDQAVVICAQVTGNPENNLTVVEDAARYPGRIIPFVDVDSSWSGQYHTPGATERLGAIVDRWDLPGFTHYLADENDGWLGTSDGMQFFGDAARRDLVASISAGPAWFPDLGRIASANPTLPLLLHHLGFVKAADGLESPNLQGLLALAAHPNVGVKVSGFYYGSGDKGEYPYVEQTAIFERIYQAFGAERLTWGSDFPVSPWEGCTYRQALDVVRRHCPFIGEAELAQILGGTMARLLATRRLGVV